MTIHNQPVPRIKSISNSRVVEVALQLVREHGPRDFTLAQVARSVSLAPATLLQRFGSKGALLQLVIEHANRLLDEELTRPIDASMEPKQALVAWLVKLAMPFRTRQLLASHLQVLEQELLDPRSRRRAKHHSVLVQRHILTYLDAMDLNLASEATSALATTIEAQWHGLILQWSMAGTGNLKSWLHDGLIVLFSLVEDCRTSSDDRVNGCLPRLPSL